MKNDMIPIKGLGFLDWQKVDEHGLARFAQKSVMKWLPKSKTDNQLVLKRVRLKDQIAIRLGLSLIVPRAMPKLKQEDGWLDKEDNLNIYRQFYFRDFPIFYTRAVKTKMNWKFHNFLTILKAELKADEVLYTIIDSDHGYVKIRTVIKDCEFKLPSLFINRLVTKLNAQL
jgi:hypothetical protein